MTTPGILERQSFSFPTRIEFGPGAVASLAEVASLHIRRPLVVTDEGLASLPPLQRVRSVLHGWGVDFRIYEGVQGNPTSAHVEAGLESYRRGGCDGLIGVGGGSALDVAKAIALMSTHEGVITDYDEGVSDPRAIRADVPPVVAVPTTAGTGSEVGRSSVITNVETQQKAVIFSPPAAPDRGRRPELMVGLPPGVTAATGMDALTHNLEAFLARGFHPLCDGIALEGLRLAGLYLRRAVDDGTDLEARGGMAMASLMGAVAFQKGLGATHSLAHPLSTVSGLHHGLANGILVHRVLAFNAEVCRDRVARIGQVIGAMGSEGELVQEAIRFVEWLGQSIGMPATLSEAGVDPADLDRLADLAILDGCHQLNPRPVTRDDLARLYREAM